MSSLNIDLILEGEFAADFASEAAKAERAKVVVRRIGTNQSTANVNRMIDQCQNTAATWSWDDGSTTVFDIRPR